MLKAKDFLLEVGTEPFPARFIAPALDQLRRKLEDGLRQAGLGFGEVRTFGTLRRLAVLLEAVAERSPDRAETVKGPPARLLKDAAGAFTPQAAGFAKKQGLTPDQLQVEGDFIWAHLKISGEKAEAILAREVVQALKALDFPKSLEWEPTRFRFGRPIRSIAAVLGSSVIDLEVAGVKSGRKVWGLAALAKVPIPLKAPKDYLKAMEQGSVIADPEERRAVLLERLGAAAKQAGGPLDLDEALVTETVFMTEQPTPVVCGFSEEFLELPSALLALVMKKQLKFFPVTDGPRLLPSFVGVRDGLEEGEALVREGYQRVLAARGNDAVFFFRRDLASSLESKLPGLERVGYQKGLGSVAEKGARVVKLTGILCELIRQDRPCAEAAAAVAAKLCYADLVTDVVKEFPELQGVMGGVYARRDKLDERVALALEHFYLPAGPKSPVPATLEGAVVSLAGQLDSLAGLFALGQAPTGSADPFALRRQALGAIRIALEHQLPLDLGAAMKRALELQPVPCDKDAVHAQLLEFLWGRAASMFEEKGFRVDEIRSVRRGGLESLKRTFLRLAAIHAVRKNPDFEPLAEAFKRAANILRQAKVVVLQAPPPERALLKDEADLSLYDALLSMEGQVSDRLGEDGYESGLKVLVGIKPHLDRFFEKVMVMVDDQVLRDQRLGLLAKLVRLFNRVADLSEIQAPSAN